VQKNAESITARGPLTVPPDPEPPDPEPPDPEPPDPEPTDVDQVVTAVLTASRLLVAVSARSLASVEDTLTQPQFRMLVVLDSRGGMSLSRLAEHLAVNPSTAMRMADRLAAIGMVTRRESEADRRSIRLALTEAGRRTVADVTTRRRAEIAGIVAAIPAGQRADLVRALHTFSVAGGEPSATPPDQTW
jgi:DNA-binding MarR family transcriptional regulator